MSPTYFCSHIEFVITEFDYLTSRWSSSVMYRGTFPLLWFFEFETPVPDPPFGEQSFFHTFVILFVKFSTWTSNLLNSELGTSLLRSLVYGIRERELRVCACVWECVYVNVWVCVCVCAWVCQNCGRLESMGKANWRIFWTWGK